MVDTRVNFHAFVGDKYNCIYLDVVHIDGEILCQSFDLSSFQSFMSSVDCTVKGLAVDLVNKNIDNTIT